MPVTLGTMTQATPRPPLTTAQRWKLGLIVAGIAAVVVGCIIGATKPSSRATDGYDAQVACKDFVRDRLKAPSTADFTSVSHTGSAPTWTVTGTVDADNSFGAKLRMTFTCVVRDDGDTWRLQSMTGLT
jgi:hypothetical protein